MSMVICDDCEQPIDTDDDPNCFFHSGRKVEFTLCELCRERRQEQDPPGWEGGFADNH